jgi:hypothetical protein
MCSNRFSFMEIQDLAVRSAQRCSGDVLEEHSRLTAEVPATNRPRSSVCAAAREKVAWRIFYLYTLRRGARHSVIAPM